MSLPKGGGAIRGVGEKFSANPVTGTGSMSVPIATSPGRSGFGPQLSLSYDSGAGNGPFGLGWSLSLPSISRKTDKGLPRYLDEIDSDTYLLAGAEDLVPQLDASGQRPVAHQVTVHGKQFRIHRYRPRIEGLFALIECWREVGAPANVFWRSISRDNVTTWFGRSGDSRVFDPDDPSRIFQWLISQTHDDKGNLRVRHQAAWLIRIQAGILPANSFGFTAPIDDQLLPQSVLRPVIEKILTHLGLDPQPPPRRRARELGQH